MLDVRSKCKALKIKWLKLLVQAEQDPVDQKDFWIQWFLSNIPKVDVSFLLKCNLKWEDMKRIIKFPESSMWCNVLQEWCALNYTKNIHTRSEVLLQGIWFNSHRKTGNKVCFNANMYNHGIRYIQDLVIGNRLLKL